MTKLFWSTPLLTCILAGLNCLSPLESARADGEQCFLSVNCLSSVQLSSEYCLEDPNNRLAMADETNNFVTLSAHGSSLEQES
ncbi:MAG: hypothetical protein F6K11_15940, partial [Leptolyngbya sp. SIO3F4]|nr:hypothetical protein [Leptolyngbya sp. SIO3F4]